MSEERNGDRGRDLISIYSKIVASHITSFRSDSRDAVATAGLRPSATDHPAVRFAARARCSSTHENNGTGREKRQINRETEFSLFVSLYRSSFFVSLLKAQRQRGVTARRRLLLWRRIERELLSRGCTEHSVLGRFFEERFREIVGGGPQQQEQSALSSVGVGVLRDEDEMNEFELLVQLALSHYK